MVLTDCQIGSGGLIEIGKNFNSTQIISIRCRSCIVDSDARATEGRGTVLLLNPVRIANGGQVLVHEALARPGRPRDGMVVIIAHAEHPGIVPRRHQRGGGCARRGIPARNCTDGARTVGACDAELTAPRTFVPRDVRRRQARAGRLISSSTNRCDSRSHWRVATISTAA